MKKKQTCIDVRSQARDKNLFHGGHFEKKEDGESHVLGN